MVRTFCMNPRGVVVNENTNGIITVNGHSYEDPAKHTNNTNFALLVSKHFSEPFHDSNGYGESIARLSNMLGGGVMVQRFGSLTAMHQVQFIYIFHHLCSCILADMLVQSSAKLIGDIVFSVGESACIFWMHQSAIWEQISTMWYFRTSMKK